MKIKHNFFFGTLMVTSLYMFMDEHLKKKLNITHTIFLTT